MQMLAFIHDHDEASAIKDCLESHGIFLKDIYTQQTQTYHGRRSPDGYRLMVADDQLERARQIFYENFPHLRPTTNDKIVHSLQPTIIRASLILVGLFLFLFGLSLFIS